MSLPRPDRTFPRYSYVPGKFPHPLRDPAGHSFGHVPEPCQPLTMENAPRHGIYQWGIQLFNHGYYWEAHEFWEQAWHACGRQGAAADYLKGLIKLAAAGVKSREGRLNGVIQHANRALELLSKVRTELGPAIDAPYEVSLAMLLALAAEIASSASERIDTSDAAVKPTLPPIRP